MKTQAKFFSRFYADIGRENQVATEIADRFVKKGFTPEQTKLKAVWENPHWTIHAVCHYQFRR